MHNSRFTSSAPEVSSEVLNRLFSITCTSVILDMGLKPNHEVEYTSVISVLSFLNVLFKSLAGNSVSIRLSSSLKASLQFNDWLWNMPKSLQV